MATTTHSPSVSDASIARLVARDGSTAVIRHDGSSITLPVVANDRSAASFLRTVRRVGRVEIDATRLRAAVAGVGHRRAFRRQIPVSMALGLAARGVPAMVAEVAS